MNGILELYLEEYMSYSIARNELKESGQEHLIKQLNKLRDEKTKSLKK